MGQIKNAHGPLRLIYRMLVGNYETFSDNLELRLIFKALKDTVVPKGLVPLILIFYRITSMVNTSTTVVAHEKRFRAMQTTRDESVKITAEKRIQTARRAKVPPSAKVQLRTVQTVIEYSE